ncbi:MAG: hypothetical protein ND866_03670 [Pyrinomonadaceae bacterium]|nr:hypothetical protein [Pyrinomonadaceae bacterium]
MQRLGVGFHEALHLEHLLDIATVDENIGHEVIVDILAVRTLRKESSVMLRFVTQQVLLFATPAVPEILGVRVDDEATSI